jgi:glycosyltransferase involved in cell wall biosynthesis
MNKKSRSRYKKLVRLVQSSSSIISEFGFRLFLKTAYSEFKKNGFAVFAPVYDNINTTSMSDESSYLAWLNQHKITPKSRSQMREEAEKFSHKTRFLVIISIDNKNKNHLDETLASLKGQTYNNFELSFIRSTDLEEDKVLNSKLQDISNHFQPTGLNENTKKYDYTAFLNCGDLLTEDAMFRVSQLLNKDKDIDIIYSDEDEITSSQNRMRPFFKPDWSPDLFLSMDYISNLFMVRSKLLETIKINEEYSSAKLYDLLLRLVEKTDRINHIPTVLVSVRKNNKGYEEYFKKNALRILSDTIKRRGIKAEVKENHLRTSPPSFRIKYQLDDEPKVSIIIPTKDNKKILERCINAISKNTAYKNYEIIIIDNNSTKEETISYFKSLPYKIIKYELPFNFSKMNKLTVLEASGDYLLFLNDDTAPLESNWLSEMVSICKQDGVGVVGAKLVHLNNTIQHAGIAILKTGAGFHPLQNIDSNSTGYFGFVNITRNCSAVTGACLLIKRRCLMKLASLMMILIYITEIPIFV